MIGRDAELALLRQAFDRLHRERTLAALAVVGDAGIGKSRLLYEFEAWTEAQAPRVVRFRGRATPQTASQPFGLLRDILARRFQIADDDTLAAARAKLEQGVAPLFVADLGPELAQAQAHLMGHLVGIDWRDSPHLRGILEDARQIRSRAFHAAAQLLRRIGAGTEPVVLLLEDLHWADSDSLAFLDHLVDRNRDVPLLVLASTRAVLFERWPGWADDGERHRRVELRRLDDGASAALVDELLQKLPAIPAALRALLTGRAEGNPFYMEELVKMLVDQGAIRTGDPWQVDAERLSVVRVPPTITGILQARLDSLPGDERQALQQASVVGAVFWDLALAAVDERAVGQLPALTRRELTLLRRDAPAQSLREYAFHHHTLHQVTYDTVLKRHKREGHAKVGRWLADQVERGGVRGGDLLGIAADHFERAGDAASAVDFHARAAEHALGRLAHDSVTAHVGRALALLPEAARKGDDPAALRLRWRLLSARGRTLYLQSRRDELAADLAGLAEVADALDDDGRRAEVAYRRGVFQHRLCDWRAMAAAASESAACAERASDEPLRWRAMNQLAIARLFQGEVEPARELATACLAAARRLGLRDLEPHVLNTLGNAAAIQHDLMAANDYCRQSLQLCREAGDRINECIAQSNLGVSLLLMGELAQARQDLDEALRMMRANGDRVMEANALQRLSGLALWEGDAPRSRELARAALDTAVAARAREFEAFALLRLGRAEAALGATAAAREAFAQAQSVGQAIGLQVERDAIAGLAAVALDEGDAPGALETARPLLAHLDAGGTWDGTEEDARLIELTLCRVLARVGDPRADAALARAHAALMTEADGIRDPGLRQSFLARIPHHREIVAAWAARDAVAAPGAAAPP
jgi:tetratricopeptide (TPR) repeat protein